MEVNGGTAEVAPSTTAPAGRNLNSRTLPSEDVQVLCEFGAITWPHPDGRPGWYVVDRKASNGCRFTHEAPRAVVGGSLLELSPHCSCPIHAPRYPNTVRRRSCRIDVGIPRGAERLPHQPDNDHE